jgi:hypothetical protein
MIGYATYPDVRAKWVRYRSCHHALVGWALDLPGGWNGCAPAFLQIITPAIRVAEKVGMRLIGTVWEEDLDEVLLYGVEKREQ